MKKLIIPTLFMVMIGFCTAQENNTELVTDRPDQTESSVVVPKKSLQIETGVSLTKDNIGSTDYQNLSVGSTLLRYGLFETAELRFGFNYDVVKMSTVNSDSTFKGFTPIDLGTKVYIVEENGFLPELAVIVSFSLPSGSKEFKSENMSPTVLLTASHTLSENLGLGYNIGTFWDGINPEAIGKYSAALGWSPADKIGVFGEVFGTFNNQVSTHAFDAGITYLLAPNFQLDASAGLALNDNAEDYFISFGFSWRLPE